MQFVREFASIANNAQYAGRMPRVRGGDSIRQGPCFTSILFCLRERRGSGDIPHFFINTRLGHSKLTDNKICLRIAKELKCLKRFFY